MMLYCILFLALTLCGFCTEVAERCVEQSSLKNSRSNILKLHAKISALQKFIHEMQGSLQSDLSNLKAYVKEEFWERMSEVSQIVEKINSAVAELQKETLAEKEEAINKAKNEAKDMELEYLRRLEVECQKLSDAENQIHNYEDYLLQNLQNLEEIKQENQMLEKELNLKKEVIKSMMLEHELELDSLRNQMRQDIQGKDDEIFKLTQNYSENTSLVNDLQNEKEHLAETLKKETEKKQTLSSLLAIKEEELHEKLKELRQLQEEVKCLQEEKESTNHAKYEEKNHSLQLELEETKQKFNKKIEEIEHSKAQELSELKEKLIAKHRSEIESLRSRYKLAVSTTAMEKSAIGIAENLESETAFSPEDLKKVITESREKWESEKNEHIRALIEDHEKKLEEAVTDAVNKETIKCNAEKMKAVLTMRRECEESIEKSKSRLVAELQVSFNEAINSVTKEKDVIIEELRSKVTELEAKLRSISFQIESYSSHHPNEPALSQSDSGASCSYKVLPREEERLIEKLKAELESYLNASDQRNLPGPSSQDDQAHCECLRRAFLTPSPSKTLVGLCIDCTYKISILTCDVGDLILLCYENKYDSFVAFHLGQFLHLLHSDCLQPLGLKIPAGPTERWALGVVTNKEFCVAKKASNRYKMTVGTKFYRIKVKAWDRDKAVKEYVMHRNSQSSAYSSRTLTPQSSASEELEGAKGMSASSI